MIVIITREYTALGRLRAWLKQLLGRGRGPEAVVQSALRGFAELGVSVKLNPSKRVLGEADIVWVAQNHKALAAALVWKKAGIVSKLWAGPAISVLPTDNNAVLLDPEIDGIITPSPWVRDLYLSQAPMLSSKVYACPAGADPSIFRPQVKSWDVLVYDKLHDSETLQQCLEVIQRAGWTYCLVVYGTYKQAEFLHQLQKSQSALFLSKTESQGIALLEAWMCDVPTFVLQHHVWRRGDDEWRDDAISAPYLTRETGRFVTLQSLQEELENFDASTFRPREHALANCTDKHFARHLLHLWNGSN